MSNAKDGVLVRFAVEADHHRNGDLLLQAIPGCRLRSALVATRPIVQNGREYVPQDQVRHLSPFGRIPGMQIRVDSKTSSYTIDDPLFDDERMCERIAHQIAQTTGMSGQKIGGVPPQAGQLGKDEFKTLCRELLTIVGNGDAKMIGGGSKPSLEQIEDLPGDFLLNPGSRVTNTQPRYEKDWDHWLANLSRSGG